MPIETLQAADTLRDASLLSGAPNGAQWAHPPRVGAGEVPVESSEEVGLAHGCPHNEAEMVYPHRIDIDIAPFLISSEEPCQVGLMVEKSLAETYVPTLRARVTNPSRIKSLSA